MPKITSREIQTKSFNCGAFGLAAICKAFCLLPTQKEVVLCHRGRSATLEPSFTLLEAAEEIYKITGDLKLNGEHSIAGEETNSPSAISYVAKQLGLYVILNVTEKKLNELKPFTDELLYCANVADQMKDNKGEYNLPGSMECQLVVVMTSNNGLHWLAVDSDGLIYDPATGKAHSDWASLSAYLRLPIWLSFSLKSDSE